jgi:hypothetical protein
MRPLLIILFLFTTTYGYSQGVNRDFLSRWLNESYPGEDISGVKAYYIRQGGQTGYYTLNDSASLDSVLNLIEIPKLAAVSYSRIKQCNYVPGRGSIYVIEAESSDKRYRLAKYMDALKQFSDTPALCPALIIDNVVIDPRLAKEVLLKLKVKDISDISIYQRPVPQSIFGRNGTNGKVQIWTKQVF